LSDCLLNRGQSIIALAGKCVGDGFFHDGGSLYKTGGGPCSMAKGASSKVKDSPLTVGTGFV